MCCGGELGDGCDRLHLLDVGADTVSATDIVAKQLAFIRAPQALLHFELRARCLHLLHDPAELFQVVHAIAERLFTGPCTAIVAVSSDSPVPEFALRVLAEHVLHGALHCRAGRGHAEGHSLELQ